MPGLRGSLPSHLAHINPISLAAREELTEVNALAREFPARLWQLKLRLVAMQLRKLPPAMEVVKLSEDLLSGVELQPQLASRDPGWVRLSSRQELLRGGVLLHRLRHPSTQARRWTNPSARASNAGDGPPGGTSLVVLPMRAQVGSGRKMIP